MRERESVCVCVREREREREREKENLNKDFTPFFRYLSHSSLEQFRFFLRKLKP
jgi:hypothetical protein